MQLVRNSCYSRAPLHGFVIRLLRKLPSWLSNLAIRRAQTPRTVTMGSTQIYLRVNAIPHHVRRAQTPRTVTMGSTHVSVQLRDI